MKRNGIKKSLGGIALSIALCFGMAMPAFAASAQTEVYLGWMEDGVQINLAGTSSQTDVSTLEVDLTATCKVGSIDDVSFTYEPSEFVLRNTNIHEMRSKVVDDKAFFEIYLAGGHNLLGATLDVGILKITPVEGIKDASFSIDLTDDDINMRTVTSGYDESDFSAYSQAPVLFTWRDGIVQKPENPNPEIPTRPNTPQTLGGGLAQTGDETSFALAVIGALVLVAVSGVVITKRALNKK